MAKVFGDPLLKKPLGQDTLYLRADTLISLDDSLEANKRLLAFHNVQIYKSDLQGKADSLVYYLSEKGKGRRGGVLGGWGVYGEVGDDKGVYGIIREERTS